MKKNKNEIHDYNAKNEQKKASKFENTLLISGIILLVIIIIIILLLTKCGKGRLTSGNFDQGNDTSTSGNKEVPIDPNQQDPTNDPNNPNGGGKTQSGEIAIPGYGAIHLVANSNDARIQLLNPEGNSCYFQFTIGLLSASGDKVEEVLYTSKYVEPGKEIRQQTLSRGLPAGTYNAVIQIRPLAMNGTTKMNGTDIKVTLKVK
jgi:hypothetical protein